MEYYPRYILGRLLEGGGFGPVHCAVPNRVAGVARPVGEEIRSLRILLGLGPVLPNHVAKEVFRLIDG